jgi:hypothetical protein
LVHQSFWLIATWHAEAVPQGAQPVPVVVPSVPVKSNLVNSQHPRTMMVYSQNTRLGQYNHTSLTVPKVGHKLGSSTGVDSRCTPTTSDALGETLRSARDTDGAGAGDAACYGKKVLVLHLCLEQIESGLQQAAVLDVFIYLSLFVYWSHVTKPLSGWRFVTPQDYAANSATNILKPCTMKKAI